MELDEKDLKELERIEFYKNFIREYNYGIRNTSELNEVISKVGCIEMLLMQVQEP
jgi:hypothetical protein